MNELPVVNQPPADEQNLSALKKQIAVASIEGPVPTDLVPPPQIPLGEQNALGRLVRDYLLQDKNLARNVFFDKIPKKDLPRILKIVGLKNIRLGEKDFGWISSQLNSEVKEEDRVDKVEIKKEPLRVISAIKSLFSTHESVKEGSGTPKIEEDKEGFVYRLEEVGDRDGITNLSLFLTYHGDFKPGSDVELGNLAFVPTSK